MKTPVIDRIEELSAQIRDLEEAESLAEDAQPQTLSEIRDRIYAALREMRHLAQGIMRHARSESCRRSNGET
jgi:hypothetical protein